MSAGVLISAACFVVGIVGASVAIRLSSRNRMKHRPAGSFYSGHALFRVEDIPTWKPFGLRPKRPRRFVQVPSIEGVVTLTAVGLDFVPSRIAKADGVPSVQVSWAEVQKIRTGPVRNDHLRLQLDTAHGTASMWVRQRYLDPALHELNRIGVPIGPADRPNGE